MNPYQAQFDSYLLSNAPRETDAKVASGDGDQYYYLTYAFGAALDMAEATGDAAYLETALAWCEGMIARATIIDKFGCKNWRGTWPVGTGTGQQTFATVPISYGLNELNVGPAMARACWVVNSRPLWKQAYKGRAAAIVDYILTHIVDKQLIKWDNQAGLRFFEAEARQTAHAVNDKVLLLQTILAWTKPLDPRFQSAQQTWLLFLKARFKPYQEGILWDEKVFHVSNTTNDTNHAARVPDLFAALHATGDTTFSARDRTMLARLFTRTIWNRDRCSPKFCHWADGATGPLDGLIAAGWQRCAVWHEEALEAVEAVNREMLDGFGATNYDSQLCLPAQLARIEAGR